MDTISKVVLGCTGSIAAVCIASYARCRHRSTEAVRALDGMELELKLVREQFNDADVSKVQAERMIDNVIERYMAQYMNFTLDDKVMARRFFETHRENNKKLLGIPS